MSTALYRRYRPETFAEVIGQEHVTAPLSAAIDAGRINHAFLFSGPRGCGKTTSARILARCLNCAEGPTSTPCGECPSCRDLANGGPGSLDVVEIDAASHNGVDDARDLRERAVYAPARDRYKVFILDEAHMVTPQGFNALLKLVEEPPAHVKFVFATTEPDKVIGTIRSRTHHYPFRLVPPETLGAYLETLATREGVQVGAGVLPLVVRAGGGSVRDTLSVLDQLIAGASEGGVDYSTAVALLGYTDDSLLGDIVDAFSAADGAGVFRVIDRVIESGHDPRRFVEDLLERFRDLFVISAAQDSAAAFLPEVPQDRLERLKAQARAYGPAELSRAADLLNAGLTEMSGATSPRLQLELICARILLPGVEDSRRSVVSRVDRLERRVGMSADGRMPAGAVPPAAAGPAAGGHDAAGPQGVGSQVAVSQGMGQQGGAASSHAGGASGRTPGASAQPAPAQDADPYAGIADAMASARSVLDEGTQRPAAQERAPQERSSQERSSQESAAQQPAAPQPAREQARGEQTAPQNGSSTGRPQADPRQGQPTGPDQARAQEQSAPGQPDPARVEQQGQPAQQPPQQGHQSQPGQQTQPSSQGQPSQGAQSPQRGRQVPPPQQDASAPSDQSRQPAPEAQQSPQQAPTQPAQSQVQSEQSQRQPVTQLQYGEAHASPEIRQAPGVGAEIDAIRRGWPDVLARLQQLRKLSYAIVSGNAFPQQFADGVLSLGFSNPGSVQAFRRGPHAQFVSTAVEQSLGIRAQVEVGDENAGPPPAPAAGGPGVAGGPGSAGGHGAVGGSSAPGGSSTTGGPHAVTREQLDSVVGPREADREPVDHDRFWQSDASSARESHDDAEGDSPQSVTGETSAPAPVDDPWAQSSDLPAWSTDAPSAPDAPSTGGVPSAADVPSESELADRAAGSYSATPTAAVDSSAPGDTSGRVGPSAPVSSSSPVSSAAPAPENPQDERPAPKAQSSSFDSTSPFDGAPDPVETSAGEGAVDFGAVVVPPPVDIEPFPDEEPYPPADQGSYGDPYPPEDPFRPEDSYAPEDPYAGGGYDAQSAPAQTPPSAQSEPPANLDFLGAYADVDIAFTDNPGAETNRGTTSATTSGLGDPSDDGPLGRYARLAQRHSGDAAPGSAPVPPPVEAHVPDPVENYADYDTAGDADIQASTEFGPAVVERILGGVIIEEIDE